MDYYENIKGSDSLSPEWGERFRGWTVTKVFNRTETISLTDDITYQVKVCDYQYRFIMPERVEFSKGVAEDGKILYGVISYSDPERLLGVFRFPREESGFFAAPVSFKKTAEDIVNLTTDQLKELINKKKVLTFEAFRIPFFGFQYFSIVDSEFDGMRKGAGEDFISSLQSTYKENFDSRINEIKTKILSLPNYLLILENVLDLKWKNETEISMMSGGIIHFGI